MTFVISETDKARGRPKNRFLFFNKRFMYRKLLHIALLTFFFAQANGQVVFRAIGNESTLNTTVKTTIEVSNFNDVAALQFSMTFDTLSLIFQGAADFGLPVTSSNFFESPKGQINFLWVSADNVSLTDGTIIFSLAFTAIEVTKSKVTFDLNSTFDIADNSGSPYPFDVYNAGINTTYLEGNILFDKVENCQFDSGDLGLNDIPFRFENSNYKRNGTSDLDGSFNYTIDTGNVVFSTLPRTTTWEACTPSFQFDIINYSENKLNSFLQPNYECAHMEVDISASYLLPCSNVTYWVDYRNNGSTPTDEARIIITLDSFLTFTSSSITPSIINEKSIEFNLGHVGLDQGGRFSINVNNSCSGTIVGQAQCLTAKIFPDSICDPISPLWDGTSVQVEGKCKGDSVQFKITNTSSVDIAERTYVIIEDMLLGYTSEVQLPGGESTTITQVTNNQTWRLLINQSPNHPGRSYPTIALEGCDGYTSGTMLGSVTEFAEDDADYFISKDCQESKENPPTTNTITGHPKGYGADYMITSHTDLTYLIYFKNVSDTVLTSLVIRDSLSENLDIISVQPGASSHTYDFSLEGENVVRFDFPGLSIPPNGEGFVKFRVSQMPNNPINTIITNQVVIEMSGVVLSTNNVFHTIGGESELLFLMVDTKNPIHPEIKLNVYPNPFRTATTIEIEDYPSTDLRLRLYGINGSVLLAQSTQTGLFQLSRGSLLPGTYVFVIEDNGAPIASGKLIIP